VGKSNVMLDLYPEALYLDLLLPEIGRTYLAHPEYLKKIVAAHSQKIQKAKTNCLLSPCK
jgi:hypothetical protein